MATRVSLYQEDNCYYLTQDISGLTLYQKTKVIDKFVKQETKVLENCVENDLRAIFSKFGINIQDTSESALNSAFDTLKGKGKNIEVTKGDTASIGVIVITEAD